MRGTGILPVKLISRIFSNLVQNKDLETNPLPKLLLLCFLVISCRIRTWRPSPYLGQRSSLLLQNCHRKYISLTHQRQTCPLYLKLSAQIPFSLLLLIGLTFFPFSLERKIMKDFTVDRQPNRSHYSQSSKKSLAYLGLVVLGMGIGIGGTYAISNPQVLARVSESSANITQPAVADTSQTVAGIPAPTNFVVDVVKETGPAVVRINSERKVKTAVPPMMNDPFFRNFFGSQMPQMPDSQIQHGTGSGFIVSEDGRIFTNAHVVAGADEVTVTLKDGRTLKGKVLGSDPTTDVAVVKIEADHLPVVKVGNSDRLQVGEWAIAIGNPLGLDNTVTTGIISATGRSSSEIGVGDKRVEFIQTDAAINPGNSGGPLLNANGEVIGMNTAIIQNAQGIGFAIPIHKAQQIAEQIITKGKVDHPFLGIQMVEVTPELKQQLKENNGVVLKADSGIAIMKVIPNSPADLAGIESGDVIQSVNDKPVKSPSQVQALVEETQIGSELPLKLSRDGKIIDLKIKVGIMPSRLTASEP